MSQVSTEFEAKFQTATALRDGGDLAQARSILEKLAVEEPEAFGVWLVLGGIQMSQEDYEGAEESFGAAIQLRPRSELASLAMFHTLKHLHGIDDAFAEMDRYLALCPDSSGYDLLLQELEEGQRTGA